MTKRKVLKALLLPPGPFLLLLLAGAALDLGAPALGLGRVLMLAASGLLLLNSLPLVSHFLLRQLDRFPALPAEGDLPAAEAIVILDGGGRLGAWEYGGVTVENATLERLRYGATLQRRAALPILVSGNGVGQRMARVLEESFQIPVRWAEVESRDTLENAQASAQLLRQEGISTVFLVTHFWHLPRAVAAFRHQGLQVLPAPMGFRAPYGMLRSLIPGLRGFEDGYLVAHEAVGLLWYRWRHGIR